MKATYEPNKKFLKQFIKEEILPAVEKQNEQSIIEAKRYCPVDTGLLRDTLKGVVIEEEDKIISRTYSDLEYAIYQELGTSRILGQYFFRIGALKSAKALEDELNG